MLGFPLAFSTVSFLAVTSMKSTPDKKSCFPLWIASSWKKRTTNSGWFDETTFSVGSSTSGDHEEMRPRVPFANRLGTSKLATSIALMRCGRDVPGGGWSCIHCPAKCSFISDWLRTALLMLDTALPSIVLSLFVALLKTAFTRKLRLCFLADLLSTIRFHRSRYVRLVKHAVLVSKSMLWAFCIAPRTYACMLQVISDDICRSIVRYIFENGVKIVQ